MKIGLFFSLILTGETTPMSDYWSQYWKQGHITSFGEDIKGNYQGNLKALWQTFFSSCSAGQRVLDIGTGNGALLDIALEQKCDLHLLGVDSALLTVPVHLANAANVDIHQNIKAESLPFEDSHCDAVISQFGIEYADLAMALKELARVLKSGGQFQLVLHDSASSIVQPNAQILSAAKDLLASNGVLQHLRLLVASLAETGETSAQSETCRGALNSEIAKLANRNEAGLWGTNFPAFLKHVMSPAHSLAARKEKLGLFESELIGQIERLSDLVNAALTPEKFNNCIQILTDLGLTLSEQSILTENQAVIARVIRGFK